MKERITNLGNYCLICGKGQEIRGLKPVPCGSDMCRHRHDELGFGADLHEVMSLPAFEVMVKLDCLHEATALPCAQGTSPERRYCLGWLQANADEH